MANCILSSNTSYTIVLIIHLALSRDYEPIILNSGYRGVLGFGTFSTALNSFVLVEKYPIEK